MSCQFSCDGQCKLVEPHHHREVEQDAKMLTVIYGMSISHVFWMTSIIKYRVMFAGFFHLMGSLPQCRNMKTHFHTSLQLNWQMSILH